MRPFIAFILVFFNLPLAEAQINLVPNPSFEDTVYCPFAPTQIDAAVRWSTYRNTPDYFKVYYLPFLINLNASFVKHQLSYVDANTEGNIKRT